MDVSGTSDEQPEEAGRRQMIMRVADDRLTIEAADPIIIASGRAALEALGEQADPPKSAATIRPRSASATVWQAMHDCPGRHPAPRDAARRRTRMSQKPRTRTPMRPDEIQPLLIWQK